jgi:hypothetical protein
MLMIEMIRPSDAAMASIILKRAGPAVGEYE